MKKDSKNNHRNISDKALPSINHNIFNQTIIVHSPKINIQQIQKIGKVSSRAGFFQAVNNKHNHKQQNLYFVSPPKTKNIVFNLKMQSSPYAQKFSNSSIRSHKRTISTHRQAIQVLKRKAQRDISEPPKKTYLNQYLNQPPIKQKIKFRNSKFYLIGKSNKNTQHVLSQRTILPLETFQLKKELENRSGYQKRKHGSTITMLINHTTKLQLQNLQNRKKITTKSEDSIQEYEKQYEQFLKQRNDMKRKGQKNSVTTNIKEQNRDSLDISENSSENIENYIVTEPLLSTSKKNKISQFLGKTQNLTQLHVHRKFHRSIEKITDCFLKRADNYFDHTDTLDIPASKIQFYASTISQPQIHENRSHREEETREQVLVDKISQGYDFQFEQEKSEKPKKTARTPYKRKQIYEISK